MMLLCFDEAILGPMDNKRINIMKFYLFVYYAEGVEQRQRSWLSRRFLV